MTESNLNYSGEESKKGTSRGSKQSQFKSKAMYDNSADNWDHDSNKLSVIQKNS